jgi:hypothetical protein
MGTKQFGWTVARPRFFALVLSGCTAAVVLSAGSAHADPKRAREKMVELNKQALLSYEAKDFETAKDLLTKALKEAKGAGLEDDKMTARTYLHMGAVYWVGFQDQAVALQNFSLAKKIRPDIQLTPSIETPDLKSVFDLATVETEPEPAAAGGGTAPPVRPQPRTAPAPSPKLMGDAGGEPNLPTSFSAPLLCAFPPVVPPNKELTIRCALRPGLKAKVVQIHYRTPGVEAYQTLGMRKTAKGWYLVTLPSSLTKAGSLQVYFDARDAADNELATNGQVDSPSIIEVKKKSVARDEDECPIDDPLCKAKRDDKRARYEAGLHRRREGAFWFGVGAGLGWGYVPAGKLEWEKYLNVSAMTTVAGMFNILPEVGYMWSDNFALAAQMRLEFMRQDQAKYQTQDGKWNVVPTPAELTGKPTTMGAAGFLRGIWYTDITKGGNFRLSYSADVGGGFIRFPVKPSILPKDKVKVDPNGDPILGESEKRSIIYLTDTRPIGMFLLGASGGFLWNLHRHFAIAGEVRFLTGLPAWGAVVEGQLSLQLALGGVKGPPVPVDEDDDVVGPPTGDEKESDAPTPADEPPTTDLGSEEE